MSMALDDKQQGHDDHQLPELAEPRSTAEVAEALAASGMVDELLAQIDTGQVQITGDGGLIPGLIKLALERGLKAELTDHLGYDKGDPAGRELPNARNGSTPKTVASEAGPVELNVLVTVTARSPHVWSPRGRAGSVASMTSSSRSMPAA